MALSFSTCPTRSAPMPTVGGCNIPASPVGDEVRLAFTCFVLGFAAFKAVCFGEGRAKFEVGGKRLQKSAPSTLRVSRLPRGASFDELPWEIAAEVVCMMDLRDVASLAATNMLVCRKFWQAAEVWTTLSRARGLETISGADDQEGLVREAFRRNWFRVDCRCLCSLGATSPGAHGGGHVAVLGEAAHVVRGLMPGDGNIVAEGLCRVAERALQGHDPANKDAGRAAEHFLHAARRRAELLSGQQIERLEGAYNSALQLQELMEVTMQDHLDQFELNGFYTDSPASTPPQSTRSVASSSSDGGSDSDISAAAMNVPNAILRGNEAHAGSAARVRHSVAHPRSDSLFSSVQTADVALEDVHEEQRSQQLDVLLEELRLNELNRTGR